MVTGITPAAIIQRVRPPSTVIPLDLRASPLEVAARWPLDRPLIMLHSGRVHRRWARWSILASPVATYRFHDGRSQLIGPLPRDLVRSEFVDEPLIDLQALVNATRLGAKGGSSGGVPFHGGWIGYFSYDLGRCIEPRAQCASPPRDDRHWPLIELNYCADALIYDHQQCSWMGVGDSDRLLKGLCEAPKANSCVKGDRGEFFLGAPRAAIDPDRYMSKVSQALEDIAAGDIFQANIAQRFTSKFEGSTRAMALQAFRSSQPWYGAYLELPDITAASPHIVGNSGGSRRCVVSLSPELFLKVDSSTRQITARPIKGTRPANVDPRQLCDSAKDTAELHMIVDLMRNDLGRICEFGSIRVPQPRLIESHPTVHHGVAEITGRMRSGVDIADILKATFPGGSVTGAPKIRAMQIIDELESARRGPYCGAIGYLSDCGDAQFNIAIRTMLVHGEPETKQCLARLRNGSVDYWAGAGIVADSNPRMEHLETLAKRRVLRPLYDGSRDRSVLPVETPIPLFAAEI